MTIQTAVSGSSSPSLRTKIKTSVIFFSLLQKHTKFAIIMFSNLFSVLAFKRCAAGNVLQVMK